MFFKKKERKIERVKFTHSESCSKGYIVFYRYYSDTEIYYFKTEKEAKAFVEDLVLDNCSAYHLEIYKIEHLPYKRYLKGKHLFGVNTIRIEWGKRGTDESEVEY